MEEKLAVAGGARKHTLRFRQAGESELGESSGHPVDRLAMKRRVAHHELQDQQQ